VLHQPRVVFLDEPTSGVDPLSRRGFWRLIDEMAASGVTVFVTTHYLDEAEYCHRLALIHAGRLVALGTVSELKQVFAGHAVLEVVAPSPGEALEALAKAPWALETSVFGTRIHVVVRDAGEGRREIAKLLADAGNAASSLERILPSLEDVFIHHVEQAEAARHEGAPAGR
jgi:ABC-2 type transport system ATP-binding protein